MNQACGRSSRHVFRGSVRPARWTLCFCLWVTAGVAVAQPRSLGERVDLNDGIPREVEGVRVDQRLGERLPSDILLRDSEGVVFPLGSLFESGRPLIVTLNYSDCPMLCNVQLTALTESLGELRLEIGKDFDILTVSIDPEEPGERIAATKRSYLSRLEGQSGGGAGWRFCTAEDGAIERLTDALGFRYRYDARSGEYFHPAMLAFVSPEGIISRYSLEVYFPPDQLRMALVEAGQGKVGKAVDQLLLWCYTYDPDRNSYVPHAWKLMRLGGGLTIGLMFLALLPYWRGRRGSVSPCVEGPHPVAVK